MARAKTAKRGNTLPKCWQTVQDALTAGIDRVILYGAAGVGKTYAGLNYGLLDGGAHRLICTDEMTNADVTGCWQPTAKGSWSWLEGAGIKAWKGNGTVGGRLVIDEIDKAGGDVFATLLAITDSPESARWENPETHQVLTPLQGFSVVMTTNIEDMNDLPMALKDRFPVAIRINQPHPEALLRMSEDLRSYAKQMCDAGERRISLRSFYAYDTLRKTLGAKKSAEIVFGDRAKSFLDAIQVDTGTEPK
jgi:MoxR-like ATPase